MIIDHIAYFIPDMPIQMRWMGRLAMPLFLYSFIIGIEKTKCKECYIKRLYRFNIITCILLFIFNLFPEHRNFLDVVSTNIFGTYVAIIWLIEVIEYVRTRKQGWAKILSGYILWQVVSTGIGMFVDLNMPIYNTAFTLMISQISGNIFTNEGRLFIVLLGVGLYYARQSKKSIACTYVAILGLNTAIVLLEIPQKLYTEVLGVESELLEVVCRRFFGIIGYDIFSIKEINPLYSEFGWMAIFALPFMLMYNGERGKYHKYFYYIFYPAHLVVLLIIQHILS